MGGAVDRAPEPRLSASVILVRETPAGPDTAAGLAEVFLVRRHERSHLGAVLVFPGGTVRADDSVGPWTEGPHAARLAHALAERSDEAPPPAVVAAVYACAVRELFEEAGVLLVSDQPAAVPDGALREARLRLQREDVSLADVIAEWGVAVDFEALTPFSHWVTPAGRASRFDTWFFVARLPAGQQALHCAVETTAGTWLTPAAALAAVKRGESSVIFPTHMHLRRLAETPRLEDLLRVAGIKPIKRVMPRLVDGNGAGSPHVVLAPELRGAW